MGQLCGKPKQQLKADEGDGAAKAAKERNQVFNSRNGAEPKGFEATHKAIKLLGRGATADTWLFEDKRSKRLVAIKLFQRPIPEMTMLDVVREVQVQSELAPGSVNLINVYELSLTEEYLAITMEYAAGGVFTSRVSERAGKAKEGQVVMPEDETRYFFRQFIETVDYCHSHKTAHRDLKLDNFLLDSREPPICKLCDFGFARHFGMSLARTRSHIGTPEYMSPELLHQKQDEEKTHHVTDYDPQAVDVWASGVLLSVALCGAFPFDHTRPHEGFVEDAELDLWLQAVTREWSKSPFLTGSVAALSPEVRDLLGRIFTIDPTRRITLPQIKAHPWYNLPIPEQYQRALDEAAAEQKTLDAHIARRQLDQAKLEERNKAIRDLVAQAVKPGARKAQPPVPNKDYDATQGPILTVDLTEEAITAVGEPRQSLDNPLIAERTGHADRPYHADTPAGNTSQPVTAPGASTAAGQPQLPPHAMAKESTIIA